MLQEILPSGISLVSGGTRLSPVFWRPQISFHHLRGQPGEDCPLEYKEGSAFELAQFASGWRVRKNEATPYPYHHLILPMTCYDWMDKWRELGGVKETQAALSIAAALATESKGQPLKVACHVGYSAGQNWFHPHWHVHGPKNPGDDRVVNTFSWIESNKLVLYESPLRVVIGGSRAGKCWFHNPAKCKFEDMVPQIGQTLGQIITLYALKFTSTQGLPPDYSVLLRIAGNGEFQYGCLTPVLNNLGAVDLAGYDEGTEVTLPWPHQVTLKYLKGSNV